MSDLFQNTDHSWIDEHMDVLDETERYLITSLFTYELPLKYAADALEMTIAEASATKAVALQKLKNSVEKYQ